MAWKDWSHTKRLVVTGSTLVVFPALFLFFLFCLLCDGEGCLVTLFVLWPLLLADFTLSNISNTSLWILVILFALIHAGLILGVFALIGWSADRERQKS